MREKKDDKFLIMLKDFFKSLAVSLVVVFLFTQFLARPVRVEGLSMYPTLENSDAGFSNIIGTKISDIKRFDVVVLYHEATDKHIVKRVIGLPGETVEYKFDELYINGQKVAEPFLDNAYASKWRADNDLDFTTDFGPITVPEGEYFVLGDNRQNSTDSRNPRYGTFKHKYIKSKDVFVMLPLNKMRHVGR